MKTFIMKALKMHSRTFLWQKSRSAVTCTCLASKLKCLVCRCSNKCINENDNKDDLNTYVQ